MATATEAVRTWFVLLVQGFMGESLSAAERQAQLLVQVLPGWALNAGLAHAVFTSRRGQVPAVRSFLDYLGDHMRGENLVESQPKI